MRDAPHWRTFLSWRASGVTLPTVALTHELLTAARELGLAKYDFAVVFDVIARLSGLPPTTKTP